MINRLKFKFCTLFPRIFKATRREPQIDRKVSDIRQDSREGHGTLLSFQNFAKLLHQPWVVFPPRFSTHVLPFLEISRTCGTRWNQNAGFGFPNPFRARNVSQRILYPPAQGEIGTAAKKIRGRTEERRLVVTSSQKTID